MTYQLPDLPYDYNALAPAIIPEILELHHDKHHATYVKGANTALEQLAEARDKGNFGVINKLEKDLAFNLGGHFNHSVFWTNLTPGGSEPTGGIKTALDTKFGGLESFQKEFSAVALGIQGSGWAVLGYDAFSQDLRVYQVFDHQGNLPVGQAPLLVLDLWEHAFYLQYKNVKADYVKAFWDIVNWDDVNERLTKATQA
ncbi:superoxide dismutase [Raineyella sp. W15-4]|uniref:superoxide dismutase n=1 Tax=Raineyella sp. W15-4 TaxID=3081651 RepID=UPI00295527C4|nr:superoxide dismutase [Raineyella sp. W15-4]WOQ17773.1 superoxide dismutase [Raineyella sp. W15-4]